MYRTWKLTWVNVLWFSKGSFEDDDLLDSLFDDKSKRVQLCVCVCVHYHCRDMLCFNILS